MWGSFLRCYVLKSWWLVQDVLYLHPPKFLFIVLEPFMSSRSPSICHASRFLYSYMIVSLWLFSTYVLLVTSLVELLDHHHDMSLANEIHSYNINPKITYSICVCSCNMLTRWGNVQGILEKEAKNCVVEHCKDWGMTTLSFGTTQCTIKEGLSWPCAIGKSTRQGWWTCWLRMRSVQCSGKKN